MPDELVTVSAAHVLQQISGSLDKGQKQLDNTLNQIGSVLRPASAGASFTDATSRDFVAEREAELLRLRGDIQSALGAVRMLDVISPSSAGSPRPEPCRRQLNTDHGAARRFLPTVATLPRSWGLCCRRLVV